MWETVGKEISVGYLKQYYKKFKDELVCYFGNTQWKRKRKLIFEKKSNLYFVFMFVLWFLVLEKKCVNFNF